MKALIQIERRLWIFIRLFNKEIKKRIKTKILEFFDSYEKSVFKYFESLYEEKEEDLYEEFKTNLLEIDEKLKDLKTKNLNKSGNFPDIYKELIQVEKNLENLCNNYQGIKKGFETVNKCEIDLSFDIDGVFANIKMKSKNFMTLGDEENTEES